MDYCTECNRAKNRCICTDDLLINFATRGRKYESKEYLAKTKIDTADEINENLTMQLKQLVHRDMPITQALHILVKERGMFEKDMRYGCFNLDGTLIEDPALLKSRGRRNMLYYMIATLFNISRGRKYNDAGSFSTGSPSDDPVPPSPENNWAVLISEHCNYKRDIERAIEPLVKHRAGRILTTPKLTVNTRGSKEWIEKCVREGSLPKYLLICDSFENIELEFQFILNAFLVTGRLWFDNIANYETYTKKVLDVEKNNFAYNRKDLTMASPLDDPVTSQDFEEIIQPIITANNSFRFNQLFRNRFSKQSLMESAKSSRFLALYCHGVGLKDEDFSRNPQYQGSFVLDFNSNNETGLLTPEDVTSEPFVPSGILFSPACLAGGTQADSDFASWIKRNGLTPYLGQDTGISAISSTLLGSSVGPVAALMHFDISLCGPMFNPHNGQFDLQKRIHHNFVKNLIEGQTIGKATKLFRSAAGAFYAQAFKLFGQVAGSVSFMGRDEPNISDFVRSMNQRHVTATDMRNYIILGDPAVKLL